MCPRDDANKSAQTPLAVLGLGANLGDRLATMRSAVEALGEVAGVRVTGRSSVYETAPIGGPPQPDYLNAAVLVLTTLRPSQLLERALDIERMLGRRRPDPVTWGPRLIDIDLLWMSQGPWDGPDLQVPHPRLNVRPFALIPLLELVPDAIDPVSGRRYASLTLAQQPLRPVATL